MENLTSKLLSEDSSREANMVIERIALAAGVAALLAFTSTGSTQVEEDQSPESKDNLLFHKPGLLGCL